MPRRLVRNWPGCTISASTERSSRPPTARRSSVTWRGAGAAVGGVDAHRIVEHFERQAGRFGVLLRQHDRACAGVEHHRYAHAVDARRNVEIAGTGARDFHGAAMRDHMAGNEFGEYAIGDIAELEAIGIADHQNQADHDPQQRRGDGLGETLAEHRQHGGAEEHQDRELVGERAEIVGGQRADPAFAALGDDDQNGDQNADQEKPKQALAHGECPLRPRRRGFGIILGSIFGVVHCGKPRRQLRHDPAALAVAQRDPASDLVERTAAADADLQCGMDHADAVARR